MSKKIQFALFSPQAGQSWHQLEERAHRCEKLGFHSMWLVDHMWTGGMPDLDHHECLALMAGLAAKTEKIRIGTLVMCNSYRNPALLAKTLTTIDHISNGRLEIGYGAGWMDKEYKAYGYEFPSMGTRLKMFEEGLHIMKTDVHREARDVQRAALLRSKKRSAIRSRCSSRIHRSRLAAAAKR